MNTRVVSQNPVNDFSFSFMLLNQAILVFAIAEVEITEQHSIIINIVFFIFLPRLYDRDYQKCYPLIRTYCDLKNIKLFSLFMGRMPNGPSLTQGAFMISGLTSLDQISNIGRTQSEQGCLNFYFAEDFQ